MFEHLHRVIDPYAREARDWMGRVHGDGQAYMERIIARLDAIRDAIYDQEWEEGRIKFQVAVNEFTGIVDVPGGQVPMGTEWVMEVFSPVAYPTGNGTIVLRVNGQFRAATNLGTSGPNNPGVVVASGIHLAQGDVITLETIAFGAGEFGLVYMQFKARKIRSPRARYGGQPEHGADAPNEEGAMVQRHSTPGIFQGQSVNGADRPAHVPPPLPGIGR